MHLFLFVDQIVLTAEIEARKKNQVLEIQVDPELEVQADRQLIYSAIYNLIQNALKYTRVGGEITIRGRSEGDCAIIEVEDECGGLSGKAIDLFKPFEQQNEDRTGLGLGLTIAQRAMALNHGKIEVQNLPGKGCVFKMTIPYKGIETHRKHESHDGHTSYPEKDRQI